MEDYKKEAHKKYEQAKEQERVKKELQQYELQQQQEQYELQQQQEQCKKHDFNEKWMIWMTLLEENTLHSLHELTVLVETIPMEQDYVHERMVELVEQLNIIQETRTVDATEARFIHEAVSKLVQLTKIDIEIQAMDTSKDEDYAKYVERTELEEFQDVQDVQDVRFDVNPIPICSIEKRIGITVSELREIARLNNIKIKGNKRELCMGLAERGLVRLV